VRHPVCSQVYSLIGGGKKGREIRESFKAAPFGWPQDAIDAALVILTLAGNLRATANGQPVQAKELNQTTISNASFYQDVPPLTVVQRLDLKAIFQKLGVTTPSGQESAAALEFLNRLVNLADSAGGDAPQPAKPPAQPLRDLQALSGNAQLLALHNQKDALTANIVEWTQSGDAIAKRLPRWQRLTVLHTLATGLPEASTTAPSLAAIQSSRNLLADPDPVPPIIQTLLGALRTALNQVQADLNQTHQSETARITGNPIWSKLTDPQRQELSARFGLHSPPAIRVAAEDDILATLQAASLTNRRTLVEALPQRFARALDEAARLLEPKAVRVTLPSATIHNEQELDAWLADARETVVEKLDEGPVIL
jgi:hypothetical protein